MMKSGTIQSQGLELYYEISGKGEPVILLNGGPGLSHEILLSLENLGDQAQLIFYDQRGTGRSSKADPGGYTVAANVEDLEALRCALGLGPCVILGHSWGGMLAQAYALTYPQGVKKLILADTFSSIQDLNTSLARMRAAVPEATRAIYEKYEQEGLYRNRDRYPDEYQAALDVAYEPVMISVEPPPHVQNVFAQLSYDVYRAMWGEESEFYITGTLADFDAEPELSKIEVPTLVIVGASDMPTVEMARKTASLIPNGRLEVFEQSRHFPFLEEPDKFFQVVRRFLNG